MSSIIGFFGWESRLAAQAPIIKNIRTAQPDVGISNKDMQNICSSALSALFNQPTTIINVDGIENGLMHLSYTLPTDNTLWQYTCKIEGKNVIWATKDGGLRTDKSDEHVAFQLTQDEVVVIVTFPDGSIKESRFPR